MPPASISSPLSPFAAQIAATDVPYCLATSQTGPPSSPARITSEGLRASGSAGGSIVPAESVQSVCCAKKPASIVSAARSSAPSPLGDALPSGRSAL